MVLYIAKSEIHGNGLFSKIGYRPGETVLKGVIFEDKVTPFGRYINHCNNPSTTLRKTCGSYDLVALRTICAGDEITANYWMTPHYIAKPNPKWNAC